MLSAIINTNQDKPTVKMYTGEDGVKVVLEDILTTMQEKRTLTLLAASRSEIIQRFPKYFPKWMQRRESLNIRTKLILPESERTTTSFQTNPLRETRYLPKGFTSTIEIYGTKMAIFNLKDGEIYSIVIESGPIVQTFIQFFNTVWENALK
jgi:hypothetical protein